MENIKSYIKIAFKTFQLILLIEIVILFGWFVKKLFFLLFLLSFAIVMTPGFNVDG